MDFAAATVVDGGASLSHRATADSAAHPALQHASLAALAAQNAGNAVTSEDAEEYCRILHARDLAQPD